MLSQKPRCLVCRPYLSGEYTVHDLIHPALSLGSLLFDMPHFKHCGTSISFLNTNNEQRVEFIAFS